MALKPIAHLVDGSLYVCRAWFAQVPDITDADGAPVHAVHGFTRFLLDLFERARPTHVAVAFDEPLTTSFRHAIYPDYKAHRPPAPADLVRQFQGCKDIAAILLHHFGTLDALLERADEVAFLRARGATAAALRLREHAALARLSRALTGIALDAPVPAHADDYRRRECDATSIEALFDRLRLGPLTRARVRALASPV
jgi:5'-3' exonuclease